MPSLYDQIVNTPVASPETLSGRNWPLATRAG